MRLIDLLNRIANGEEVPKKIKYNWEYEWAYDETREEFVYKAKDGTRFDQDWLIESILNNEVEILDDEEDKDIPLIPDDELYIINKKNGISEINGTKCWTDKDTALNYNFKVLKEKINQVVEELNKRQ